MNKKKSTKSKVVYDQSVTMVIHETRSGNIIHTLNTAIKTAYFPENTSREMINAKLQRDLKNGLTRIRFPELIDPELIEKQSKLSSL